MTCLVAVHYGLSAQHLGTARAEGGRCCPGGWQGAGRVCATPPRELEFLPGRCGRSSHALQRVPRLPWEWRCSTRRRGGRQGCSSPTCSLARAGIGGCAWQLTITMPRARSSPNPPPDFTPSLAGGRGRGWGWRRHQGKAPPYRPLPLQPRYPSATRAVPRGLVLPQALRHVPAVPSVRLSVRPSAS